LLLTAKKGLTMNNTAEILPFDEEGFDDIVFEERIRRGSPEGAIAHLHRYKNNSNVVLGVRKSAVEQAFPGATHFDFNCGRAPNNEWIKLFPNKRGVRLSKGALYFSVSSYIDRDRFPIGERTDLEVHVRKDAIYIKLPKQYLK